MAKSFRKKDKGEWTTGQAVFISLVIPVIFVTVGFCAMLFRNQEEAHQLRVRCYDKGHQIVEAGGMPICIKKDSVIETFVWTWFKQ